MYFNPDRPDWMIRECGLGHHLYKDLTLGQAMALLVWSRSHGVLCDIIGPLGWEYSPNNSYEQGYGMQESHDNAV